MPSPAHALTIDVEDWFHICGVGGALDKSQWTALPSRVQPTTRALIDLLDRCGVRATFFVLGWVAERFPDLVATIVSAGHEIGSHGHMHDRVYELTPEMFGRDLDDSLRALRGCGIQSIAGFRAPEWSINGRSLWALDVLAARGIRLDSSMAPMRVVGDPRYPQDIHRRATASGDIVECPPAVGRLFGAHVPMGGGWGLRSRRPAAVLRSLDRRLRAGRPAVVWLHPWEIDDDPPRVKLPAGLRFAHYFGLAGFRQRLETILRGSSFAPLSHVARMSAAS